jgi:hypothetical protein
LEALKQKLVAVNDMLARLAHVDRKLTTTTNACVADIIPLQTRIQLVWKRQCCNRFRYATGIFLALF